MEEVMIPQVPNVKIEKKSDSKLMKTIAFFVRLFNPRFNEFITTIGSTIYVPDNFFKHMDEEILDILMHEFRHIKAHYKNKVGYNLGYLFPQLLALFSLLSLGAVIWLPMLWFLAFLVFLLPFPALWRYKYELDAYRVSILSGRLLRGYSDREITQIKQWIKKQMITGNYYWAWPFPSKIDKDLEDESFILSAEYKDEVEFLKRI
jgi:hypothetical protein